MTTDRPIFNFDSKGVRDMAKRAIENARGLWTWNMVKLRDQRSLEANGYYWSVVLPHVAAGIREAWGEDYFTAEDAHEFCRDKFLSVPVVDRRTGEAQGRIIRSTAALDKAEFAVYLDRIIDFAAKYLRTEIPEADRYRAKECA